MLKKLVAASAFGSTGLYGIVYANSDELKQSHTRVLKACQRAARMGFMGARLAVLYNVYQKKIILVALANYQRKT